MSITTQVDRTTMTDSEEHSAANFTLSQLGSVAVASASGLAGAVIGRFVGVRDDGRTPLVVFAGQRGTAAVAARSIVDVHAGHVGRHVVLTFEDADTMKPIIMGILRGHEGRAPMGEFGRATVDADGERMIVTARNQIVLQCGKASITLTASGKVLIQGTYVLSRASGVNRIRGGSVQIN